MGYLTLEQRYLGRLEAYQCAEATVNGMGHVTGVSARNGAHTSEEKRPERMGKEH